ncbi:MAG: DUF2490 domain-containing protein [Phenylobacterium sp.]|uniref:DUF2490 domain-containing protein n=1 Tax=Phenylobacterium sp. TaxID=1871053 RepID=UPI001A4BDCC7|nr:DUF2490 domain-containing protein [Phenylobacterium sp.]MBL8771936.1 DUF2490 domain-containing protein [Phenylobacterium sp.]
MSSLKRAVSIPAAFGGAVALAVYPAPAAAADEDVQAWTVLQASRPISERWVFNLDTQARFNEDAGRLGQFVLRPSIGWRLDGTRTLSLGYVYNRSSQLGRAPVHEHRIWQQLAFRIAGDGRGPTLTGRTRLEQRRVENREGAGWRLRQQLRFTAPLAGEVRGVVTTEPFIGLNGTAWGQRDGLAAWRSFAGVSIPVSPTLAVEPGYLHQHTFRPGEDAVIHAASVTLTVQF